jgi:hypothetical protein
MYFLLSYSAFFLLEGELILCLLHIPNMCLFDLQFLPQSKISLPQIHYSNERDG